MNRGKLLVGFGWKEVGSLARSVVNNQSRTPAMLLEVTGYATASRMTNWLELLRRYAPPG